MCHGRKVFRLTALGDKLVKHIIFTACVVVSAVGIAAPAVAQSSLNSATINFQYREPIPQNGDTSAARSAILAAAEKDCAIAEKAFGLKCEINNIQFNGFGGAYNFGNPVQGNFISGNVNAILAPNKLN